MYSILKLLLVVWSALQVLCLPHEGGNWPKHAQTHTRRSTRPRRSSIKPEVAQPTPASFGGSKTSSGCNNIPKDSSMGFVLAQLEAEGMLLSELLSLSGGEGSDGKGVLVDVPTVFDDGWGDRVDDPMIFGTGDDDIFGQVVPTSHAPDARATTITDTTAISASGLSATATLVPSPLSLASSRPVNRDLATAAASAAASIADAYPTTSPMTVGGKVAGNEISEGADAGVAVAGAAVGLRRVDTQVGVSAPHGTHRDIDVEDLLGSAGEPQMQKEEEEDGEEKENGNERERQEGRGDEKSTLELLGSRASHQCLTAAGDASRVPGQVPGMVAITTGETGDGPTPTLLDACTTSSSSSDVTGAPTSAPRRKKARRTTTKGPRGPQIGEETIYGTKVQTPQVMGMPWHEEGDTPENENKLMMIRRLFAVYRFKGLGLTFQKPLKNWYSVGFGCRIPLTAHFPNYDRYVSLPRLSMSLVGYWPYDCKVGFSCSVPVTQVLYAAAVVSKESGLSQGRFLERVRRIKASDSIKRVGINVSFYYNKKRGLRTSMGPWGFYLPTRRVMRKVMPILLTLPAILASLLDRLIPAFVANRLLSPQPIASEQVLSAEIDDMTSATSMGSNVPTTVSSPSPAADPTLSHMAASDSTLRHPAVAFNGREVPTTAPRQVSRRAPQTALEFRAKFLKWASTKTGGLGTNISFSKKTNQPASMGSTLQFNVSPFFRGLGAPGWGYRGNERSSLRGDERRVRVQAQGEADVGE